MKRLTDWLYTPKRRILASVVLLLILMAGFCLYRTFLSPLKEGISIGGVLGGGRRR